MIFIRDQNTFLYPVFLFLQQFAQGGVLMEELVSALNDVSAAPDGKDLSVDRVRLTPHHCSPHGQTAQAWSPV